MENLIFWQIRQQIHTALTKIHKGSMVFKKAVAIITHLQPRLLIAHLFHQIHLNFPQRIFVHLLPVQMLLLPPLINQPIHSDLHIHLLNGQSTTDFVTFIVFQSKRILKYFV